MAFLVPLGPPTVPALANPPLFAKDSYFGGARHLQPRPPVPHLAIERRTIATNPTENSILPSDFLHPLSNHDGRSDPPKQGELSAQTTSISIWPFQ